MANNSGFDYSDRTTYAVKSVLIEMGQLLGNFRGKFVVIGGLVPWLLQENEDLSHVGTMDLDICLDPEALADHRYADLIKTLLEHDYKQDPSRRRFQLVRTVDPKDTGPPIEVVIDFLMPEQAQVTRRSSPLIDDFAVIRASGAALTLEFYQECQVKGRMPNGSTNQVAISIASIPSLLVTKGFALNNRLKEKDAYDIYYCVRNYDGGLSKRVQDCLPLLEHADARRGYSYIDEKFTAVDSYGPVSVGNFVQSSNTLQGRTFEQWRLDAFGQVDAWLRELKLRN
ncbi:MAG: nucleotidyl transferase AbiEii/AbiGii toxin family protein [Gammaproteobacteria bacterium]|nr:nucleotidyl transferase AbiEii/AbiGii toxin family protein [Gammaproteobacteria bacterium]